MKLSEAIRLGAMMRPQTFGAFRNDEGTCALGAAQEAAGKFLPEWDSHLGMSHMAKCHLCVAKHIHMRADRYDKNLIAHLNDHHRWTREQIADWVESIEAQHEQQSAPAPEAVGVVA